MGPLLCFPAEYQSTLESWDSMTQAWLQSAVDKALAEASELQRLADELPVRVRAKVMARNQPTANDIDYQPWGGLFPHPRVKKEGF
jgi:hypothetical protein